MSERYSIYDAKARFSELIRKVRAGESVVVTYRGEDVAEIRPIEKEKKLEEVLEDLRRKGIISGTKGPLPIRPVAKRPGALKRFLESRD